jgi:2-dehydro-3-deoxyphosphooctonate aldolase (KDO 8-P synthase)
MTAFDPKQFFLIAGPCVVESRELTLGIARELARLKKKTGVQIIFKASYDKANRSSHKTFRGPGIETGLDVLAEAREKTGLPILTDVHSVEDVHRASEVVDVLQIPAFLCRQTDLLVAAAQTGKWVNVKKGQFLAPEDMANVAGKISHAAPKGNGRARILLTERGTTFGYHNLVVDFRGIEIMKRTGHPVVFDATHSVQKPGGKGDRSGGDSEFVPLLARAAVAAGCDGLFVETHPNPEKALSDGPNMVPLKKLLGLIQQWLKIRRVLK